MTMTMDDDGAILVHLTNPGGIVGGSGVANQIAYWTDTDTIGGDTGLVYNAVTNRVGIGLLAPQGELHVKGSTLYGLIKVSPSVANNEASIGFYNDAAGTVTGTAWIVGQGPGVHAGDFVVYNENGGAGGDLGIRLLIKPTGFVAIGPLPTPIAPLHISMATYPQFIVGDVETDATGKHGMLSGRHYTTAEEPVAIVYTFSSLADNYLSFGGSAGQMNAATVVRFYTAANNTTVTGTERARFDNSGRFVIGATTALGRLHVDQFSGSGAMPVLYLDQADVSEEMIEFACTIGAGNAIEAVGGKTLTTTHFIKVTLPGALTRYIPVGTIA